MFNVGNVGHTSRSSSNSQEFKVSISKKSPFFKTKTRKTVKRKCAHKRFALEKIPFDEFFFSPPKILRGEIRCVCVCG
jgi:hypothetical protein